MPKRIKLSKKAEKRYLKMDRDFIKRKNVKSFSSVSKLINDLNQT